ncbi:2-amino-4-hydroxy-6-hydroxymethyldihydropteridine diphosphokinase [Tateyamaria sp.]|uniref:2-amino-4-hydroxy-6- hydroxymethyldihydropteridine diphosphokinase n=1 Tax=Tateyamaria sp. TaxID=1929288 RepID=UPI003B217EF8
MSQDTITGKISGKLPQDRSILLIAVGSNMDSPSGTPAETILSGVEGLRQRGAVIRAQSRFFQTPAFPPGAGPDFVNGALMLETGWTATEALAHLHAVEADLGRVRRARWGARAIDLDLLAIGDTVQPDTATVTRWMDLPLAQQQQKAPDRLILPHPRLHERAFVLVPLADIAPDWVHPILGRSVRQMVDALPADALAEIVPLSAPS